MSEVDYVPFATGGGANVYTPATYQALSVVGTGVEPGLADPQLANTTWRLASMISAAVATFISNILGISVLDDGNLTNLVTNLTNAVSSGSKVTPGRIITSSANFNVLTSDYAIGLNRTSAPAATQATMPTPSVNQEFRLDDLGGNASLYPITVALPGGHSFPGGLAAFKCDTDKAVIIVHYYGSSLWGVSMSAS